MKRRRWVAAATVTLAVACASPEGSDSSGGDSSEQTPRDPAALAVLRSTPAVGYDGPEDHPFEVRLRTPAIDAFPCTSCHDGPVTFGDRADEEHADVQPVHPSDLAGQCGACHAAVDPARLSLNTGETASLDEAYRLCAQCHYAQGDAWAGGAHGKRLVAWSGPRVVMSCTECHDPHEPAFAPRIPFRPPNIPRTGAGA